MSVDKRGNIHQPKGAGGGRYTAKTRPAGAPVTIGEDRSTQPFPAPHPDIAAYLARGGYSLEDLPALAHRFATDDTAYLYALTSGLYMAPMGDAAVCTTFARHKKLLDGSISLLRGFDAEQWRRLLADEKTKTPNPAHTEWARARSKTRPACSWGMFKEILICAINRNRELADAPTDPDGFALTVAGHPEWRQFL